MSSYHSPTRVHRCTGHTQLEIGLTGRHAIRRGQSTPSLSGKQTMSAETKLPSQTRSILVVLPNQSALQRKCWPNSNPRRRFQCCQMLARCVARCMVTEWRPPAAPPEAQGTGATPDAPTQPSFLAADRWDNVTGHVIDGVSECNKRDSGGCGLERGWRTADGVSRCCLQPDGKIEVRCTRRQMSNMVGAFGAWLAFRRGGGSSVVSGPSFAVRWRAQLV